MSEQTPLPEYLSKPNPILQLARGLRTPFTPESEAVLQRFAPRMPEEEKISSLSSLQEMLQQADVQSGDTHQARQVLRQIGIVLTTAHVHYVSDGTWPQMAQELEDAYQMADQTSEVIPAFGKIADQIDVLMYTLAQKQYRL